ncbi:MAG: hypothetical protein LBI43_00370 [Streptococcaceae bacterium]|nr:hypothetical protein [Streptococcaceae bacterium]
MENKKSDQFIIFINLVITLICIGPSLWLVLGLYHSISNQQKLISTFLSIPCLLLIGYIWGNYFQEKRIMRLSKEADKLELEVKQLKSEDLD